LKGEVFSVRDNNLVGSSRFILSKIKSLVTLGKEKKF